MGYKLRKTYYEDFMNLDKVFAGFNNNDTDDML